MSLLLSLWSYLIQLSFEVAILSEYFDNFFPDVIGDRLLDILWGWTHKRLCTFRSVYHQHLNEINNNVCQHTHTFLRWADCWFQLEGITFKKQKGSQASNIPQTQNPKHVQNYQNNQFCHSTSCSTNNACWHSGEIKFLSVTSQLHTLLQYHGLNNTRNAYQRVSMTSVNSGMGHMYLRIIVQTFCFSGNSINYWIIQTIIL